VSVGVRAVVEGHLGRRGERAGSNSAQRAARLLARIGCGFSTEPRPRHRKYAVGVKRKRRPEAKHTAASITIDRSDGQVIGPASWPLGNGDDLDIKILDEIKPPFELGCPICGARATEEEHVRRRASVGPS
jgi:hypothetical protein